MGISRHLTAAVIGGALFVTVSIGVAVADCGRDHGSPAPHDSAKLRELGARWEAALNAGDIDMILSIYSADARMLPPNQPMARGSEAVRELFGSMIEAGLRGSLKTIEAVEDGDLGYRVGRYELTAGGVAADEGKFLEIWRRIDGEWKIVVDTWNSDRPPVAHVAPGG